MGQNQAASQSSMDELLTSLRKVIEPGKTAEDVQLAAAPAAATPANLNSGGMPFHLSSSEEISNLRKRIARNWDREGQAKGFAALLSGRASAGSTPEPVLLEDRSLERNLPSRPDPEPVLRQAVSDSDGSDFAHISTPEPKLEPPAWRAEIRPPASPSWPSAPRGGDEPRSQGLMSEHAIAAANASFNRFAETLMSRAFGDRSFEDMTREMLRPMLKQWLDDRLPELVERIVRDEIERVARRGAKR